MCNTRICVFPVKKKTTYKKTIYRKHINITLTQLPLHCACHPSRVPQVAFGQRCQNEMVHYSDHVDPSSNYPLVN